MTFGTVTNFDGNATVRFARRIDASRDVVWRSLTSSDELSEWLAPAELVAEVGGQVLIDFGPDQKVSGKVAVCEPARLIEYSWTFTGEPDSVVRFELAPDRDGTSLILEHRLLPPDQAAGYGAGWHAYLDILGARLSGGEPVDWDERFSEVMGKYAGA